MRRLVRRWAGTLVGAAPSVGGGACGWSDPGGPRAKRARHLAALAAWLLSTAQAAAQPPLPTIRSASLAPDTGVLTIVGEHLGPSVQVMVDGQLVSSLPGATDTQVEVLAPVTVRTTPGTYRLVVFDPVRKAWDGFVVASAATPTFAVSAGAEAEPATGAGPADAGRASAAYASAAAPADGAPALAPRPLAIIEDTGSPWRTALGHFALDSNTGGTWNTAVGFDALTGNTLGFRNSALGYRALAANLDGDRNTAVGAEALDATANASNNTAVGSGAMTSATTADTSVAVGVDALRSVTNGFGSVAVGASAAYSNVSGSYNVAIGQQALFHATGAWNTAVGNAAGFNTVGSDGIFLGAIGETADSNTMRLGTPYDSATGRGQNRSFIAGVRGTTVTGGQGVYIDATGQLGSGPVVPAADTVGSAQVIVDSLTAADLAPASVGSSEIADGAVTASKVAFTFAGLGVNTFAGTQTVNGGNLDLDPSSTSAGNVTKNGVRFLHDSGVQNVFLGEAAGGVAPGDDNVAVGAFALEQVGSGERNAALGSLALERTTSGTSNTASGYRALSFNTTGARNTAVGSDAGLANATGSDNIYLGANVTGTATDANTLRLGLPFNVATNQGQTKTFIAGVAGTVLTTPAVQVFIDANGQLGTLVPAPFTGTINQPINTNPRPDAALLQALDEQRALIATLTARIAALEAKVARPSRR